MLFAEGAEVSLRLRQSSVSLLELALLQEEHPEISPGSRQREGECFIPSAGGTPQVVEVFVKMLTQNSLQAC